MPMNNGFGISDESFQLILDCLTKADEIEKALFLVQGQWVISNLVPI
jgi:hypothetical protein